MLKYVLQEMPDMHEGQKKIFPKLNLFAVKK